MQNGFEPCAAAGGRQFEGNASMHGFTASGGAYSYSGLMLDPAGNLYGTTLGGGVQTGCDNGCGVVFEIKP